MGRAEQDRAAIQILGPLEEGLTWIGRETEFYEAADAVEQGAIRHLCETVRDANPLYYDEDYAKGTVWEGLIAPPTSLYVWCMPPQWAPQGLARSEPQNLLLVVPLPGTRILASDVRLTIERAIRPGDRLKVKQRIVDIVPKTTRLGEGCFITVDRIYRNQLDRQVGCVRMVAFRYVPRQAEAPSHGSGSACGQ